MRRPELRSALFGTTRAERAAAGRDGELTAPRHRIPLMATSIAMPPDEVWSYLIQMGSDRAGFYSWDRLDNSGRPSARRVHEEWQDVRVGDRMLAAPDGSVAFTVVALDAPCALVLRLSLRLPSAEAFDPDRVRPRAFVDATWGLFLSEDGRGGTRLVSSMRMRGRPNWLYWPLHVLVARPAHWIMQRKQFAELRRRADAAAITRAPAPRPEA